MAIDGVRIIDFPALGAVTDSTKLVAANPGTGLVTAAQVRTYTLGGTGGIGDQILALQTRASGVEAGVAANSSAITSLASTAASASALTALTTTVGTHTSQISTLQTTTASTASALTSLSSTVGGHTSTLSTLSSVNATLGATYELKTNVSGQVIGFGLANTGTTTGSGITFTTANFKVSDGTTGQTPFEIAGGVVSIKNAAIQSLAIDEFKLADGSVKTAKMALNAASEAFSFYAPPQPQHNDTVERGVISGTIVVPTGGSAYLFPRAQGTSWDGTAFVFRVYVNGVLTAQLDNPASNFTANGAQSLQTPTPQILVLGVGNQFLQITFAASGVPSDPSLTPQPLIAHLVGFVQKK